MLQAFVSRAIVTPDETREGALLVEDGILRAICGLNELPPDAAVEDFGQCALLPGLVDTHVHINEPGRTEWEGFATATRAAAAGGFTTLIDMPLNCLPETTTVAALEAKRAAAAGKCRVDWMSWGGAVADNQAHLPALAAAGVPGFKCFLIYPGCDGFSMINRAQLERALPAVAYSGLPLLVHAELAEPIESACATLRDADWRRYSTYLASRPETAELAAIDLLLELCGKYLFRLHIVHLSSAAALRRLHDAKRAGLPVTVETSPHYLCFAAEGIPDGATLFKCAPPIRSRANQDALWAGLQDGTIDLIATDHSPCPPEMKRADLGRFDLAWGGVSSLSVAFAALYGEARARGFTLRALARWMSPAPAALAGLGCEAGALLPGRPANFFTFNPDAAWTVTADDLYTRHAISPYVGRALTGVVEATYLRGNCIWRRSGREFPGEPAGRELTIC